MKDHCLIFLTVLFYIVSAEDAVNSKVYRKDNFNDEIAKNNNFVMFYAPWSVIINS